MVSRLFSSFGQPFSDLPIADERWLEWLDSKIALLINRDGVDPRAYAGKSYDEYVTLHLSFSY